MTNIKIDQIKKTYFDSIDSNPFNIHIKIMKYSVVSF